MKQRRLFMQNLRKQDDYNDEPVFYCKHCLSLLIINDSQLPGLEYCKDCGSTNIESTHVLKWEEMYKQRYGFKLLDKKF